MEDMFNKYHLGSFLFLCILWFVIVGLLASYSNGSIPPLLMQPVVTFVSTVIIAVILHRIHDTLREIRESNNKANDGAIVESINKLNERLKTVARMIDDIKDIEQKISERPPVIIQKKESN